MIKFKHIHILSDGPGWLEFGNRQPVRVGLPYGTVIHSKLHGHWVFSSRRGEPNPDFLIIINSKWVGARSSKSGSSTNASLTVCTRYRDCIDIVHPSPAHILNNESYNELHTVVLGLRRSLPASSYEASQRSGCAELNRQSASLPIDLPIIIFSP